MKGQSILEARECLEIFIRSLPPNSFFNFIRFGSKYESLFPTSVKYTEKTCTIALKLAKEMKADLGNTNLFNPLKDAFEKEPKSPFQRQFFILTDGFISHCEPIFNLVSENKIKNRCFTVGIGKNADLCLVEGVAHLSFGKNIFVLPNESLADKVIPLLQDSLNTNSILPDVHVEGNDSFEISPFPIPNIAPNDCYTLFFHSETSEIRNSILFSAHCDKKCEILVPILEGEENSFHDIKDVIYPLFCFHLLQKYEMRNHLNRSDMEKAVSLSISSGIICKYTAFIGVSTKQRLKSNKNMYFWLKRKGNNEEYEEYVDASMQICRLFTDDIVNIYQRNLFDDIKLGASLDIDEEIERIENLDNEIGDSLPIHDKESCQPEINKFMSLIQLQTFGGFWQDLETVNRLTEVNIHSLGDLKLEKSLELKIIQSINNKKESDSILCTFLVIAIFRKMWSERKDAWMMIENKAINWLKDQLPSVEIESVIQNIESLLSSNQ